MTKRFGAFTALDDVSIKVAPGTFHALLGENGAGKCTLVKCIMGFYRPDDGAVAGRRPRGRHRTRRARRTRSGSAWSTSTSRWCRPDRRREPRARARQMCRRSSTGRRRRAAAARRSCRRMPFRCRSTPPVRPRRRQKQKLEILKQLYLRPHFLVLDEPTSVLTPQEADEVLGLMRG